MTDQVLGLQERVVPTMGWVLAPQSGATSRLPPTVAKLGMPHLRPPSAVRLSPRIANPGARSSPSTLRSHFCSHAMLVKRDQFECNCRHIKNVSVECCWTEKQSLSPPGFTSSSSGQPCLPGITLPAASRRPAATQADPNPSSSPGAGNHPRGS